MSLFKASTVRQTLASVGLQPYAFSGVRRIGGDATRHGNDLNVLEKGKRGVLSRHSKGNPEELHWHEEVATDAEAFVKATRGEIACSREEIRKLQEKRKNPNSKSHN